MHRCRRISWGLCLGLLAGCGRVPVRASVAREPMAFLPAQPCALPLGSTLPTTRASDTLSAPFAHTRIDAARAYAARHLPGGYLHGPTYPAPHGRATLWLRDTTARAAVLAAVAQLPGLTLPAGLPADSVDTHVADWDSAALYDWLHDILTRSRLPPGVNGWGIDERRARIHFALVDAASAPALVAHLERLQVPCGLVIFAVWGPVSLAQAGVEDGDGRVPEGRRYLTGAGAAGGAMVRAQRALFPSAAAQR